MKYIGNIFFIMLLVSNCAFAEAPLWIKAYGHVDCQEACKDKNLVAIKAGIYSKTNSDMYVCSTNVGGAQRPGDNTEGQRTCHAATGGKAIHSDNKYCLCRTSSVVENWVKGFGMADCGYVCRAEGKQAMLTGYSYVCKVNAWSDGWRAGDNARDDRKCSAASAGKSCWHDNNKYCLCTD